MDTKKEIQKELEIKKSAVKGFTDSHTKVKVASDKDTKDLIEHLKKKGIDLTTVGSAVDLGGLKLIYTFFDRSNANNEFTKLSDFKSAWQSLIGKPLAIDHLQGQVVGHFVDVTIQDNKAIAYAVFYKRHFPDLWKKIQDMMKNGTLKHSWHILTPKGANTTNADGNEVLKNMILSGGSLIINKKAAYPDAYVIKTASKKEFNGKTHFCKDGMCFYFSAEETAPQENPKPYVYCPKCGFYGVNSGAVSVCPRCGTTLLPATEEDLKKFKAQQKEKEIYINCPHCGSRNWQEIDSAQDSKIVRCLSCLREYVVKFAKLYFPFQMLDKRSFRCPSCGYDLSFYTTHDAGKMRYSQRCPNCGLEIDVDLSKAASIYYISSVKERKTEDEENLEWLENLEGGEENDD